jgi:hypothetical protein
MRLKQKLTVEDAEIIGLNALTFVAEDEARLGRFLALTGLSAEELRASAGETSTLRAVLEYLAGDESMLLVFAAAASLPPERIGAAISLLDGAGDRS